MSPLRRCRCEGAWGSLGTDADVFRGLFGRSYVHADEIPSSTSLDEKSSPLLNSKECIERTSGPRSATKPIEKKKPMCARNMASVVFVGLWWGRRKGDRKLPPPLTRPHTPHSLPPASYAARSALGRTSTAAPPPPSGHEQGPWIAHLGWADGQERGIGQIGGAIPRCNATCLRANGPPPTHVDAYSTPAAHYPPMWQHRACRAAAPPRTTPASRRSLRPRRGGRSPLQWRPSRPSSAQRRRAA